MDNSTNHINQNKQQYVKCKVAIFIGYNGSSYSGLQFQHDNSNTIEETLINAMVKINIIPNNFAKKINALQWSRGARTDKGVHAQTNCVASKVWIPKKEPYYFEQEHNNEISNIKISKYKRAINFNNIVNLLNQQVPDCIRIFSIKLVSGGFTVRSNASTRIYEYLCPINLFQKLQNAEANKEYSLENFKYKEMSLNEKQILIEKLNSLLQIYKGTHNFHNFAKDVKFTDKNAKRHMIKLSVELLSHNTNYILIKIHGQSFMYHQIRKMIGIIIEMCWNDFPSVYLQNAFMKNIYRVMLAPPDGLMLNQITFEKYHQKQGLPEKLILNCDEVILTYNNYQKQQEKDIQRFKEDKLYQFIIDKENSEKPQFMYSIKQIIFERFLQWQIKLVNKNQIEEEELDQKINNLED